MHGEQNESHGEQIQVLPMNDVPLISGQWFVDENIRKQAERENQNSQIDPAEKQHEYGECGNELRLLDHCFEVHPTAGHEYVTGIMDNQDHDTCRDLVAHHREQDQAGSHKMMQHPLIVFFIIFLNHDQFENGEDVDTQLETEVHFQLGSLTRGPVGVLPVNLGAGSTSSHCGWKPILIFECEIRGHGGNCIENGIVAELEHKLHFFLFSLGIVVRVNQFFNLLAEKMEEGVFGGLSHYKSTKTMKNPKVHHMKESTEKTQQFFN